jgi:uncharacterized protein YjbJ (UPF0337 family)
MVMDENRVSGAARSGVGKLEEGAGRVIGDKGMQAEGRLNQAAGAAQQLYGQTADAARESAVNFDDWFRDTVGSKPYVTAIALLGVGWLLGRMHRPM